MDGEAHGQRSLVGYSPQGLKESDTTEQLHFHFSMHIEVLLCEDEGRDQSDKPRNSKDCQQITS